MHHLGAAPEWMPLLGPDGAQIGRTRVSLLQLASRTRFQLERLAASAQASMQQAATAADYERAAHHRDEVAAVRAELGRRSAAADAGVTAADPDVDA